MRLLTISMASSLLKSLFNVRYYATAKILQDVDIGNIRNIGILAHIDAGKTTTTERMLYYSGLIHQMGEVHHGNTVTDFMSQERERGITITSAAVTFHWKKNQFNLIDTPGHIDFTMEVEQTLNVLDGAVVVLDGSAGVEAQTLTVWRQADRYKIPRIVFVNKMDRKDASLSGSCQSIEEKLGIPVVCLQRPILKDGNLIGVVDILTMEKIIYDKGKDKTLHRIEISSKDDPELFEQTKIQRSEIVDRLTNYCDTLADLVIKSNSLDDVSTVDICKALRQVTIKQQAVPVLMGSAYKNIGIQPLMDSVILYLPSPQDLGNKSAIFGSFGEHLAARAFKVRHDKYKGPLVFFRVYNGEFKKGQKIYSVQQDKTETSGKLYVAYADDYQEVESVRNGNIAVVGGLKQIMSGDLVTNSQSTCQKIKQKLLKSNKAQSHQISSSTTTTNNNDRQESGPHHLDDLFGSTLTNGGPQIPEPVFFCSIEPPSLAYQGALEQALTELEKEDPSLRVHNDPETGQTVLSGMGELHLEIIKDRILQEYKVDAELGPLQIAYREAPINKLTDTSIVNTKIGNTKHTLTVKLSIIPHAKNPKSKSSSSSSSDVIGDSSTSSNDVIMRLDRTPENASNIAAIYPKHLAAIKQGIEVAMSHGPKIGAQVVNCEVMLHWFEVGRGTSETVICASVTQLLQKMLRESETSILEPVMYIEIVTPEEHLSAIMADLTRRRTVIQNVSLRGNMKVVNGTVPLAELMGYSTVLRTISSGTATFAMEFNEYQIMSAMNEEAAIKSVRGF